MRLSRLLSHGDCRGCNGNATASAFDPEISSLHYRSQEVKPGGAFVAVCGHATDGHRFIDDAFARGAVAVVAQRRGSEDPRIVQVNNSREALARMAAAFYGFPSERMTMIGVTGTNGKTTVTYLVEHIVAAAGGMPGVIGTVNYRYGGRQFDSSVTTPESLDLQRILSEMKGAGVSHVVMEVSSHGLDLGRVTACRFDVGAFTNLTQDHLDYHGTMAAYWQCKRRLFTDFLTVGPKADRAVAVVNTDNAYGRELRRWGCGTDGAPGMMTYGSETEALVHPEAMALDVTGIRGTVATPLGPVAVASPLVGRYNLENILCAVGIAVSLGLPSRAIETGICRLGCVPGRLEPVLDQWGRRVFVDYAHTPDALENVLGTLKQLAGGRLFCVFGCGGDRDRGKRPLMGRIARRLSDVVVITSDNPRTEAPRQIIDDILAGLGEHSPAGESVSVEPDRAMAIGRAVAAMAPEDVLLIAGKGHETYQIVGMTKRPFDDRQVAAEALSKASGTRAKGQG